MQRALLAGLAGFATAGVAAQSPGPPGEGFEVRSYQVTLRPDLTSRAVAGMETVVIRSRANRLSSVRFSPNALAIRMATVNGRRIEAVSTNDAITFALPKPLARGRSATLRFSYAGVPARGVTATPTGIYTGYFACDWMVCLQDSPGDKANLALDLVLPRGVTSLANGRALPVKAAGEGLALHRWRTNRPYSPYVYAFAAGNFARHDTRTPQGMLSYLDATGAKPDLAAAFARAPAMVAFLAEKAGLPLPDRRYAQLLVPGAEAQEAADFSLIGQTGVEEERVDPGTAWVMIHELAHQWWGNLVTCATWRDFWLNEGIATYMTAAWKQHAVGDAAYRAELAGAERRVAKVRALGFDKPLAWGGKYPSLSARRAVQYSKGALFLDHLRREVGDKAFWGGLRAFTRKHAGGTVVSADFQRAMEKASGRNLAALFGEWVYGAE